MLCRKNWNEEQWNHSSACHVRSRYPAVHVSAMMTMPRFHVLCWTALELTSHMHNIAVFTYKTMHFAFYWSVIHMFNSAFFNCKQNSCLQAYVTFCWLSLCSGLSALYFPFWVNNYGTPSMTWLFCIPYYFSSRETYFILQSIWMAASNLCSSTSNFEFRWFKTVQTTRWHQNWELPRRGNLSWSFT